jgi:hypothetical protein
VSKAILFITALFLAILVWIHAKYMNKLEMLESLSIQLSEITYTRGCVDAGESFNTCLAMSKNGDVEDIFRQVNP